MDRWDFGRFELDASRFLLREGGRPVKMERIPLELLLLLVERKGELVTREEIAARLWGNGVHVDAESGIHTAIRKLRMALNDAAEHPSFVVTGPGKGYRFISPVVEAATIAVLPFESLDDDGGESYFTEGLTEELITALGGLVPVNVRVIARSSSMACKDLSKPDQVGRELGATFLVEGSVRRSGQQLRVTAKLIRTADQVQIWAEAYDGSRATLLATQQEIGSAIARRVGTALAPQTAAAVNPSRHDPDAHDLYLRGRWYWHQRQVDAMVRAEQCFQEAIAKAPSYALAHAALASVYVLQILINTADPIDRWTRARQAATTALQLDPNLGEAHAAAAIADFYVGWDWAAAERSFRSAIELNPNDAIAHQFYAQLLSNSLRSDEAVAEIERALAIDPLAPSMHTFAAMMYALVGRHDVGFAAVRHALTLDPDHFQAHAVLGHLYGRTGDLDAALESYRIAHRLSRGNVGLLGFQGWVLGRMGRNDDARQIVATLEQIASRRHVPPCAFALVFAGLGDRDAAFHHLDRAYTLRDVFLISLTRAHWWDALRSDKRFGSLLRRIGFLPDPMAAR